LPYRLLIRSSAEKELDALPPPVHKRILAKILALQGEPRPMGVKKLRGSEGYRIRVGDYRVIYTIDDRNAAITIALVAHRREAYR
jgi:mRNA interferase RelE/StbE